MEEKFEVVDRRTQAGEKESELGLNEKLNEITSDQEPQIVLADLDRVYDDPTPIFNYVLVRQDAAETTWNGTRFLIPENVRKSPNEGVVVATAKWYIVDGKQFPMADVINPGDIVKFSRYNGEEVAVDEETFVLVSIFDVKFARKVHYGIDSALRS